MNRKEILKYLQDNKIIGDYWCIKSFMIMEDDKKIMFSYNHGDMGIVDKIIYYKNTNIVEIYDLDNYYGNTYLRYRNVVKERG